MLSELFIKASQYLKEKIVEGYPMARLLEGFPEFRQDPYVINKVYFFDKPILGMQADLNARLDRSFLSSVRKFAKIRKLEVEATAAGVYLKRDGSIVGYLRDDFFGASEPELFEELASELYRIDGDKRKGLGKSCLVSSFSRLMADPFSGPRFTAFVAFIVLIASALAAPFVYAPGILQRLVLVFAPPAIVALLMYILMLYLRRRA